MILPDKEIKDILKPFYKEVPKRLDDTWIYKVALAICDAQISHLANMTAKERVEEIAKPICDMCFEDDPECDNPDELKPCEHALKSARQISALFQAQLEKKMNEIISKFINKGFLSERQKDWRVFYIKEEDWQALKVGMCESADTIPIKQD